MFSLQIKVCPLSFAVSMAWRGFVRDGGWQCFDAASDGEFV